MGKLLEKIKKRYDKDPKWKNDLIKWKEQTEERNFLKTFSGKIYSGLKEKGEKEGVPVKIVRFKYGRTLFHYGDECALLQTHIERGGLAKSYTNMLDLQKPWWRESFLERGEKGKIENIGLIAPSIFEAIEFYFPEDIVQKFNFNNLVTTVGKNPTTFGNEYEPKLIAVLKDFWDPLVSPDFEIQFNNGNGDIYRKLRLIPITDEARDSLINGDELAKKTIEKIVENYDNLIDHLKMPHITYIT